MPPCLDPGALSEHVRASFLTSTGSVSFSFGYSSDGGDWLTFSFSLDVGASAILCLIFSPDVKFKATENETEVVIGTQGGVAGEAPRAANRHRNRNRHRHHLRVIPPPLVLRRVDGAVQSRRVHD